MTDNNINKLAQLLEIADNTPFVDYKEEARWLIENGVLLLDMTDREYAKKMKHIINEGRNAEDWHFEADDLMCEILEKTGFVETVKEFLEIPKWYA